jgi:arylsulfatase A-like enzyme
MNPTRRQLIQTAGKLTLPLLIGGIGASCERGPSSDKNLVVIVVDQLRKSAADDWLTNVNALANQGVRFEQMRSAAPWTYPSVITLLSGLYPQQHGADGHLQLHQLSVFDSAVPLLQKTLKMHGYTTAAFITNPFLHTWNSFHQGFDNFDAHFIKNQGAAHMGYEYLTDDWYANSVNASIIKHFDGLPYRQVPEFTYIHYMDVHGPWFEGAPFAPNYEASVRYIDEKLIEVYEYFMNRYQGDVIFVVTSDHGRNWKGDMDKGYGSQWRVSKHTVHEFNIRIPCLILPSNFVMQARQIQLPYGNIDFVPSIHEWLDIDLDYQSPGVSFMPSIQGKNVSLEDRALYTKMSAFGHWTDAVIWQNKKYMRFFDSRTNAIKTLRVFDLETDPDETKSIPFDAEDTLQRLDNAAGFHGLQFANSYEDIDPELSEKLRTLGYLD